MRIKVLDSRTDKTLCTCEVTGPIDLIIEKEMEDDIVQETKLIHYDFTNEKNLLACAGYEVKYKNMREK